MNLTFVKATAG